MLKFIFVLSIVSLAGMLGGCFDPNLRPAVKPEDEVVKLDTPGEPPQGVERDYKIGDSVAVIDTDGFFKVKGSVREIGEKLALVEVKNSNGRKKWIPVDYWTKLQGNEKTAPRGYRVYTGMTRREKNEWYPPSQIFPVPWANNTNLKVGDTVYVKRFGGSEPYKGVIIELSKMASGDSFKLKYEGYTSTDWVNTEDIYSSSEPAKLEDLSPGKIVYHKKGYWAIVIETRGDKVIIRYDKDYGDRMVHISSLVILK